MNRKRRQDSEKGQQSPLAPPNGGWGWAVVMASFFSNFFIDGVLYTSGIFLPELMEDFNSHPGTTSLIGSLLGGVYLIVGPVVSVLVNRFGCRPVTVCGSLISAVAFYSSTFSTSLHTMFLTYGILGGIGFGMMYLPSIVAVGLYFDTRRAMATGIALCGSGFGTFIFAPIARLLLNEYGWRGANQVMAAVMLHCAACGLVYLPLTNNRKPRLQSTPGIKTRPPSSTLLEPDCKPHPPTLSDSKPHLHSALGSKSSPSSNTLVKPDCKPDPPTLSDSTPHPSTVAESKPHPPNASNCKPHPPGNFNDKSSPPQTLMKRKLIPQPTPDSKPLLPDSLEIQRITEPPGLGHITRKDALYGGSILNLAEFKSCPDIESYRQSVTNIPEEVYLKVKQNGGYYKMAKVITSIFDFHLLLSPTFLAVCFSGTAGFMGFFSPYMYLVDYAMKQGLNSQTSSFLVSTIGLSNIASRVLAGWLADRPWADSLVIHNLAAILAGAATMVLPGLSLIHPYLMFLYSFCFGTGIAAFITLRSIVLCDLLGVQKLTNSFGLCALFQGIAFVSGTPLAGFLYERTASYTLTFLVTGALFALGGISCLPARRIARWEEKTNQKKLAKNCLLDADSTKFNNGKITENTDVH